ncbi:MAG: undecaprenyl-phosphate glucose phosphotransferase [Steroidobacteraceae bacterium]
MTQPILFKNSIAIALLTLVQIALSCAIAIASLYVAIQVSGQQAADATTPMSVAIAILFLALIRAPSDISSQLSIQPAQAVLSISLRYLLAATVLFIVAKTTASELLSTKQFVWWVLATLVALGLSTLLMLLLMQKSLVKAASNRSAVFAGYNEVSTALAERLSKDPTLCIQATGFFDDRSSARLGLDSDVTIKGTLSELSDFVRSNQTDIIFISLPIRHVKRVMDLLDDLRDTTASIYYIPDIFVFDLIQARFAEIQGMPVVAMCETPFYGYRGIIKRLIDIGISSLAILLLAPVLLVVALAIKSTSPGPVIFRQRRYGLDGREIAVYKFRSMKVTEDGDKVVQASKSDSRITPVGGFLRRSSIDELPQLLNVLQGKMSLVGPRPHAVAHNEQYRKLIKGYMVRHKVLPGITGLAQISGCRGETSRLEDMEERVKYDLEYLRHWTPLLDIKIIFLTAFKIFRDDKAY